MSISLSCALHLLECGRKYSTVEGKILQNDDDKRVDPNFYFVTVTLSIYFLLLEMQHSVCIQQNWNKLPENSKTAEKKIV